MAVLPVARLAKDLIRIELLRGLPLDYGPRRRLHPTRLTGLRWAKEFLSSRGVAYEEKNVRGDYAALRELVEDYNSWQTPTLLIDDRILVGFDPGEYESALRAAGIEI